MAGISAAEKYAEVGDQRPRCECHGELMKWKCNGQRPHGGNWKCAEKVREALRRWHANNPEYRRLWYAANREKARESAACRYAANPEKDRERDRRRSGRKRLLKNLSNNLFLVEREFSKEVKLAKLMIGGTTNHERSAACMALHKSLKRKDKEWLTPLIMSAAMRIMPPETRRQLSLESSQGV